MIEEGLVNYGVLGLWTLTLIVERYRWQQSLTKAVDRLSDAIEKRL